MKPIISAALALFSTFAFAANLSCNLAQNQPSGSVTCVYDAGTVESPAVPTITPPVQPPILPQPSGCDASKELIRVSSHLQPLIADQASAYSFVASSSGGQLKTQYASTNILISVSENACDFSNLSPKCSATGQIEPGLYYSASDARKCILAPGKKYYFNVRPADQSQSGTFMPIIY